MTALTQSEAPWIKIICTLGPSSLKPRVLEQLGNLGVGMFRLNMSHTPIEALGSSIESIKQVSPVPICIDTEGAQIRTGYLKDGGAALSKGSVVTLLRQDIEGDENSFTLRPPEVFDALEPGTLLAVDFNSILLLVSENDGQSAVAQVLSGGSVGSNKAVSPNREVPLPTVTAKDRKAIEVAHSYELDLYALSFASDEASVLNFRELVGPEATIISKVETRSALVNINGVVRSSDAILIDRGDLSKAVPMERLPFLQKRIIAKAHQKPLPVYVATNLLESMVTSLHPSRPEISDVTATLLDGANGLVLAAETAVGQYPVRCVSLIKRLIDQYLTETWHHVDGDLNGGQSKAATEPAKVATYGRPAMDGKPSDSTGLPQLMVNPSVALDAEQITVGTYAPITGFMGRDEIHSVLDQYKLKDGSTWTLPIVLPAFQRDIRFGVGDEVELVCSCCDQVAAIIKVSEIYHFDVESVYPNWFQSSSPDHPGVARLMSQGDCFIGGAVTLVKQHQRTKQEFSLTPGQMRAIIDHNGWYQVVGFHTRNTPHRAHEYIQMTAMERIGADALLVHPALGQKRSGDFSPKAILAGYEALINARYPKDQVVLSGFFSNSWYAGPREAVFTALCRKNFGCTHFILGRDHTGVAGLYEPDAVAQLFGKLGDLNIEPLFFDEIVFDPQQNHYREIVRNEDPDQYRQISGNAIRSCILKGDMPPDWMMRPEVSQALLDLSAAGDNIFEP